jgi:CheY-like chemotaxis protein
LRQTQKMEAIGQLTGGIAHDYNNLLTVILGNAELLTEALRDRPDLHAIAQTTLDAADRSATLTQRLLAFGRGQTLEAKATDINELLAGILELMRPTLGEHMKIEFRPGKDLWNPVVDRGQLETAVVNLAVNARDAMPMGGTLAIETANTVLDEDYVLLNPGAKQGEYIVIAVSDTGTGMTSDVLSRVFEPFFTTKEVGKGTGLGLSMIYGFVKQSGGHVSIYSEPDAGTVVRLYFPRADTPVAAANRSVADEAAIPTGNETILLVEDDALVRAHTEKQLTSFGYRVHVAENASNAIELVDGGLKPDLLLTDIVMPGGMNGGQLAEELRRRQVDLRVLFTSGYTHGALEEVEPMPGMNFLGKPFRRPELAAKIRELLDERLLANV